MATLEQENNSVLDLNLSLGGLFSQLPCTRLKQSHSQDVHQQKKARDLPSYQDQQTYSDDSSSHLSIASCSIPTGNPEYWYLQLDKNMKENDVLSSSNGSSHCMLSDVKKAMVTADKAHCGCGSSASKTPAKRKASFEKEEGTIDCSNSAELENGENLDQESTTRMKALVREAPQSRCGSNSDLLESVKPAAQKVSHSYMHPSFAMLPVQGPYPVPVQWGFNLPHPMQYSSHMVPPVSYFPWIAPFVPDSSSSLQPSVPAASCLEGKLPETFNKEAVSTAAKKNVPQYVSPMRELPLTAVCAAMPTPESKVCSLAISSLQPSCSASPIANCTSDTQTSPRQPLTSATSLVTDCSRDSFRQADPLKEESGLNTNFSSPTQEGFLKSVLCRQKSHDASPLGNSTCGESKHDLPAGRKSTKTVRFCCDEREVLKSSSSGKKVLTSSFNNRNQLVRKVQALGKEVLCNLLQRNGSALNRTGEDCKEEEEHDDSQITSENSDQVESALLVKDEGGAGKLEAKIAASWPRVSTTCAGLNGKTIHGVMYITESKQACLICSCHGTHMTPSEFVQHSGSTDLRNPERSIVISGLSYVKQVA